MKDLFDTGGAGEPTKGKAPLADRMRPTSLEEFVGQRHILGRGSFCAASSRPIPWVLSSSGALPVPVRRPWGRSSPAPPAPALSFSPPSSRG